MPKSHLAQLSFDQFRPMLNLFAMVPIQQSDVGGLFLELECVFFDIFISFDDFVVLVGSEMGSECAILQFLFNLFLLILQMFGFVFLFLLQIVFGLDRDVLTTESKQVQSLELLQYCWELVWGGFEKKGYFMQQDLFVILLLFYSIKQAYFEAQCKISATIREKHSFPQLHLVYIKYQIRMQYKTIGIILAVLAICYKFLGYKFILGISLIAAILLALVYFNQNKILYIPLIPGATLSPSQNPLGWRHPTEQACPTQNVQITTIDSIKLRGWLLRSETSERLLIYFHQNAGNLGHRIHYLKNIREYTNSDLLIVAYRGFSDSEGVPSEEGLQRDSEAILDWAINYKNKKMLGGEKCKIFVMGRSLGGAVALYITTKEAYSREISGLILENTFTNIQDMVSHLFPILAPFSFLRKNHWTSSTRIVLVKQPILFIRSLKDQVVPTSQMIQLIESAINAEFKMQYQIANGTHNVGWEYNPDGYFEQYNTFFERVESK